MSAPASRGSQPRLDIAPTGLGDDLADREATLAMVIDLRTERAKRLHPSRRKT